MVVIHSIEIHDCHSIRLSDSTMQSIAEHCTGLQSLSDAGLIIKRYLHHIIIYSLHWTAIIEPMALYSDSR